MLAYPRPRARLGLIGSMEYTQLPRREQTSTGSTGQPGTEFKFIKQPGTEFKFIKFSAPMDIDDRKR